MKTLIVSSNCSGGGKTTVTLGLLKALKNRNYDIQSFKVGPDYIDTGFHSEITNKPSRNLDLHLMGEEGVLASFSRGCGDLALVEGVMGLYDGKGVTCECSTYSVSKTLNNAPIVLVITPKAQSITLCAELNGIKNFKDAHICGVILNCISKSYYVLLKKLIEDNCNLKVFGYIPKDEKLKLESRHLGLVQSVEIDNIKEKIEHCANLIEEYVDLDSLISCFKDVEQIKDNFHIKNYNKKIAVAFDEAFRFYYKENLELLKEAGEVIYFSPLNDEKLPEDVDFLYIGGGYPEVFKERLSANKTMLNSIKTALEKGVNCYAECGGLMYLTESIDSAKMVGFFNGESVMTGRLNRFGYAKVSFDDIEVNCHEFHKSKVELEEETLYKVEKVNYKGDTKTWECGYKKKNTLAGYPHIHFFGNLEFLKYILEKEDE